MTLINYKAPSRDIGEIFDLPFIWNDWGFGDHAAYQNLLMADNSSEALELIYNYLISQDERIATIRTNDKHWICMGAVSQYVFEDIKYFCEIDWFERDHTILAKQAELGMVGTGWIASPHTIDLITAALELKKAA